MSGSIGALAGSHVCMCTDSLSRKPKTGVTSKGHWPKITFQVGTGKVVSPPRPGGRGDVADKSHVVGSAVLFAGGW